MNTLAPAGKGTSNMIAYIFRIAVWVRFGRNSAESDIITDYLERDVPNYRSAIAAWRTLSDPPRPFKPALRFRSHQ
jgi:hypothetical protein